MASEQVLEFLIRRHVSDSGRPFASVLAAVAAGVKPTIVLVHGA
jgi:hypothetical protein